MEKIANFTAKPRGWLAILNKSCSILRYMFYPRQGAVSLLQLLMYLFYTVSVFYFDEKYTNSIQLTFVVLYLGVKYT